MKYRVSLVIGLTAFAFCVAPLHADVFPQFLGTFGYGRGTEAKEDPLPSFIALHRWLLTHGFTPCEPVKYDNIPQAVPESKPSEETFWYSGTYQGSRPFYVLLDVGSKPMSVGLRVQISAPSEAEFKELQDRVTPLIEDAKRVDRAAKLANPA